MKREESKLSVIMSIVIPVIILFSIIFSGGHRYTYGYWLYEDEFHVVQVVRETTSEEQYYSSISHSYAYINPTGMVKADAEWSRPKPYRLVTIFKGVSTIDYGDTEYLQKLKCQRYSEAVAKYLKVEQDRQEAKAEQEKEDKLKELELEKINNILCK